MTLPNVKLDQGYGAVGANDDFNESSSSDNRSSQPRYWVIFIVFIICVLVGLIVLMINLVARGDLITVLTLAGQFSKYPDYTGDLECEGTVEMTFEEGSVTFVYTGLVADSQCDDGGVEGLDNSCGIHFHEGDTCQDADIVGGHYYNSEEIDSDPWTYAAQYVPGIVDFLLMYF